MSCNSNQTAAMAWKCIIRGPGYRIVLPSLFNQTGSICKQLVKSAEFVRTNINNEFGWWSRLRVHIAKITHINKKLCFVPKNAKIYLCIMTCRVLGRNMRTSKIQFLLASQNILNYVNIFAFHIIARRTNRVLTIKLVRNYCWNRNRVQKVRSKTPFYLNRYLQQNHTSRLHNNYNEILSDVNRISLHSFAD